MTTPAPAVPVFGDPETVTVEQLKPGDFVIEIPTQENVRGVKANSGVKDLMRPVQWTWYSSRGRGRGSRMYIPSRIVVFVDQKLGKVNVPAHFSVTVRRPQQS